MPDDNEMKYGFYIIIGVLVLIVYAFIAPLFTHKKQAPAILEQPLPPTGKVTLTDIEWRTRLTAEQYAVLREGATEAAFSNQYYAFNEKGIYECIACQQQLFSSDDKYDSGTGWPSFTKPIAPDRIYIRKEEQFFEEETGVYCSRCDGHLGELFTDGPPPDNTRYRINSVALKFIPAQAQPQPSK